jgi:hypothetical protein
MDPSQVTEEDIDWPLREFCTLLYEALKQGMHNEAIDELRDYNGKWDKFAVRQVALHIGLRPPDSVTSFDYYPPKEWTIDAGWIIRWPNGQGQVFEPVAEPPPEGLDPYEIRDLTSFKLTEAIGERGAGETLRYFDQKRGDNWFLPTEDGAWE